MWPLTVRTLTSLLLRHSRSAPFSVMASTAPCRVALIVALLEVVVTRRQLAALRVSVVVFHSRVQKLSFVPDSCRYSIRASPSAPVVFQTRFTYGT